MGPNLQDWRHDYGSLAHQAQTRFAFWRRAALGVWTAAFLVGGLTVWQAVNVNVQPYVAISDPQGRVVLGKQPAVLSDVSFVIQRRFAQDFVAVLREIPNDDRLVIDHLAGLKALTAQGSLARGKAYQAENIDSATARVRLSDEQTREIKIERAEQQTEGRWLVVWEEINRSKVNGQVIGRDRYQAVLRVEVTKPQSFEDLARSPSSLAVFDYDILRLREGR